MRPTRITVVDRTRPTYLCRRPPKASTPLSSPAGQKLSRKLCVKCGTRQPGGLQRAPVATCEPPVSNNSHAFRKKTLSLIGLQAATPSGAAYCHRARRSARIHCDFLSVPASSQCVCVRVCVGAGRRDDPPRLGRALLGHAGMLTAAT